MANLAGASYREGEKLLSEYIVLNLFMTRAYRWKNSIIILFGDMQSPPFEFKSKLPPRN